jgi:hypothetical protein
MLRISALFPQTRGIQVELREFPYKLRKVPQVPGEQEKVLKDLRVLNYATADIVTNSKAQVRAVRVFSVLVAVTN